MNKHKLVKLSDVAIITLGYPFREKITPVENGVSVIQIKDITSGQINNVSSLTQVDLTQSDYRRFQLAPQDLVMAVRGGNYTVGLINALQKNTIASSQVFVIRCTDKIKPEYLLWYLNQPHTQHQLKQQQTGTNIPMLNKSVISNLSIQLPELGLQNKIAQIQANWQQQKQIHTQLISNGDQLSQRLCETLLEQAQ